jgi:aspartyl-tRNA(Asn)/glutamyl-tRNA(Gln) amidotransferase subunit A
VFNQIARFDPLDMTSVTHQFQPPKSNFRIGVADEFFDGASESVVKSIQGAIGVFKALGAEIVPVNFPLLKYALPVYYILACAEASSNLGRYDGVRYGYTTEAYDDIDDAMSKIRSAAFGAEVKRRILLGTYVLSSGYFDAYYKKAQDLRYAITQQMKNDVLGQCDFMLTPTVPTTALKFGAGLSPVETYLTDICTVTVNITGLPAINIPCGYDGNGLPVGMQFIGGSWSEPTLFRAAGEFERATDRAYITELDTGVKL